MAERTTRGSVWSATVVLVCLTVAASIRAQESGATVGAPTDVHLASVTVQDTAGGVSVTLRATGRLKLQNLSETADPPPRVFIDLAEVRPGAGTTTIVGRGPLRRVRMAVNSTKPLVTRVVLDLTTPVSYEVNPPVGDGTELTIVLRPTGAKLTRSEPPAVAPPRTRQTLVARSAGTASLDSGVSPASTAGSAPVSVVPPPRTQVMVVPMPAGVATSVAGSGLASATIPASGSSGTTTLIVPSSTPTLADAARNAQAAAAERATASTPAAPPTDAQQAPAPVLPRASMGLPRPGDPRPWGRASFYSNLSSVSVPARPTFGSAELLSTFTYHFTDRVTDGLEYGIDLRHSRFMTSGREPRLSLYDGYVGARLMDGQLRVRAGHMWLNDLGGLGSLAGGLVEARQSNTSTTVAGKWRAGFFGGLEPQLYEVGYEGGVRKLGGYVAIDGTGARRHVMGFVRVRNQSLTERNALIFTNFLPLGKKVFVYQAAEYDVSKPAGQAEGGWSYFFTNARMNPASRLEVQLTASRGRSLDVRGLSEDVLAGRPVAQRSIDGLLYQSLGARVTVEVARGARVYAGYSRDRNNRDDEASGRWLIGGFLSNVANTGLDVAMSDSLFQRPLGSSYHSRYLSVGRMIGRALYLSGDFTTSLSVVRFVRSDGLVVEMRPATSRFGSSAVITLNRAISILTSGEYTLDGDVRDLRLVTGLNYRFQE